MINTIEKAQRDLKLLGRESEISNSTIVSMIEERLPADIENEWIKLVTGKDRVPIGRDKFPHLLKLLLEIKQRIEYRNSEIRKCESKGKTNFVNDIIDKRDDDRKFPWCWLHPDISDHPIWRCRIFEGKQPHERVQLVRTNQACFSCLQKGHYSRNCQLNFMCKEKGCNLSHHQLLHEAHALGISFHNHGSATLGNEILLKLQVIPGSNGNSREMKLSILWDSGSTLSFVTIRKAKELCLEGKPTKLQLATVGGIVEELETFEYSLYLRDKNRKQICISVLGIEKISTDIEEVRLNEIVKKFNELKESDAEHQGKGEIDCLIGIDYATYHPWKTNAVDQPILYENRFGKVIGGKCDWLGESTKKNTQNFVAHVHMDMPTFFR